MEKLPYTSLKNILNTWILSDTLFTQIKVTNIRYTLPALQDKETLRRYIHERFVKFYEVLAAYL